MELAAELVENPAVEGKDPRPAEEELETGTDYYSAMKNTGLFGGFPYSDDQGGRQKRPTR